MNRASEWGWSEGQRNRAIKKFSLNLALNLLRFISITFDKNPYYGNSRTKERLGARKRGS